MCYGIGWGRLIYLLGVVVPAVEVCSCAQMFAMGLPTTVVHAHAEKGESEAPDTKKIVVYYLHAIRPSVFG